MLVNIKIEKRFIVIKIGDKTKIIYRSKHLERVSIHLSEHCNLNCHNCDNFSPIAQEEFPDCQKLEQDMKCLSKILKGKLPQLIFTGGEPLLNERAVDIFKVARKYFPNTKISIVTNGILLIGGVQKNFWRELSRNRIVLSITKYPIKLDYKMIEQKCVEENVELEYFNDANITKTSFHMPFDLDGKQNIKRNVIGCYHFNTCIQMYDGKIYNCSIAANVKHFNKFFGKNLPANGYIDIYQIKNRKQLEKKLKRPVPLCKYCKIAERTFDNEWGISKKDIKEWT